MTIRRQIETYKRGRRARLMYRDAVEGVLLHHRAQRLELENTMIELSLHDTKSDETITWYPASEADDLAIVNFVMSLDCPNDAAEPRAVDQPVTHLAS